MTEPQVWVLIGVFGTALFTIFGMVWGFSTRILRTELGRLESVMAVRFTAIDRRFDGLDHRIDGLDHRIDRLDRRIDGLDGDVRMLIRRVTGIDPE